MTESKKIKNLQWIVFDLDGTLADSVLSLFDLYRNFLKDLEIFQDAEEDLGQLNGFSLAEIVGYVKSKYRLQHSVEHLLQLYRQKLVRTYETEVSPVRGAAQIIETLSAKYNLQVVTSGASSEAMAFIKKQGWEKYFQSFVFGDEVKKGKPDPEIYLHAISKAKCPKDAVVVIEDSVNGVKAATAAGLKTIGFAANSGQEKLIKAGASFVIRELDEISNII